MVRYDGAPTYETIEDEDYITRFYGHLKALKSIPVHEIVQEHNLPSNEANTIIMHFTTRWLSWLNI